MLATTMPLAAQQKQDMLYVYRNDGGFDAFFFGDVERIAYSNIDTLGVWHDDFVVQEIYAMGSVTRIPITAIDSVSFVTPENQYKPDVAHTATSDMWNYVTSVDSLTLYMAANTPVGMLPKVGQKLVYDQVSELIGPGFMGKVKSVTKGSGGYSVECEPASFADMFDRFTGKIAMAVVPEDTENSPSRRKAPITSPFLDVPVDECRAKNISFSLAYSEEDGLGYSTNVGGAAGIGVTLKNQYNIRGAFHFDDEKGLVFTGKVFEESEWNIAYDVSLYLNNSGDFGPTIPIPVPSCPFVRYEIKGGFTYNIAGSVGLTGNIALKHKTETDIRYESGMDDIGQPEKSSYKATPVLTEWDPEITLARIYGKATASMGGFGEFKFIIGSPFELASLSGRLEAGKRWGLSVDLLGLSDLAFWDYHTSTFFYKALNRDATVTDGLYFDAIVSETLLSTNKKSQTFELVNSDDTEYKLLPEFVEPEAEYNEYSNFITADVAVNNTLLIKEPVGFAIYDLDKEKQIGETVWYSKKYDGMLDENGSYGPYCFDDYELEIPYKVYGGQKIRVHPTTKIFNTFELWGEPWFDMTIEPNGSCTPEDLVFPQKGGSQEIMFFTNMPINNVKVYVEEDADGKTNWLEHKVNWNGSDTYWEYGITVKENQTPSPRKATAVATAIYGDRTFLVKTPIVQEGDETKLLYLEPDSFSLPGYSKDFKNGLLPTKVTVRYAKDEAKSIVFTSSDDGWLTVEESWASQKEEGNYYKCERIFNVTPNPSSTTPRDGAVTATMFLPDGRTVRQRFAVHQLPMVPELQFDQPQITLKAEEAVGSEWSETRLVNIETNLRDKGIGSFIDKDSLSSSDWIEATLVSPTVVKVRAKAYGGINQRKGTVVYTVRMKDGEQYRCSLEVLQNPTGEGELFTTNPRQIRLPAEGGELKVYFVAKDPSRPIDHVYDFNAMGATWLGGAASGQSITLAATKPNPSLFERLHDFAITMIMADGSKVTQQFIAYQDGQRSGETVDNLFSSVNLSIDAKMKDGNSAYPGINFDEKDTNGSWTRNGKFYVYQNKFDKVTHPTDSTTTVEKWDVSLTVDAGDGSTMWNYQIGEGKVAYSSHTTVDEDGRPISGWLDYDFTIRDLPIRHIYFDLVQFYSDEFGGDEDIINVSKYLTSLEYDEKSYDRKGNLLSSKYYTESNVENIDMSQSGTTSIHARLGISPDAPHLELELKESMEFVQTGDESTFSEQYYFSDAVKEVTYESSSWIELYAHNFHPNDHTGFFLFYVKGNDTKVDREGYFDIIGHMADGTTITRTVVVKQPYDEERDPTVHVDKNDRAELPVQSVIDYLRDKGMPVYTGSSPTRVNGTFEMSPYKLVHFYPDWNEGDDSPTSAIFQFVSSVSSQSVSDVSFYMYHKRFGAGPAESRHCSLTGDGNNFTMSNVRIAETKYFTTVIKESIITIVSGEVVGKNVANLYWAEVTLDSDDKIKYVEIYKDNDAVSTPISWNPGDPDNDYWNARREQKARRQQ